MNSYFCGWYYRCQSPDQTLAVIPSIHKTANGRFCTIQLVLEDRSFQARSPYPSRGGGNCQLAIGKNRFGPEGLCLQIRRPGLSAAGQLRFGPPAPLRYDIMGPFRYVPFMQCRHSVLSMRHRVDGQLQINGVPYVFQDALGYTEGDRGRSFPSHYLWTQSFLPEGSVMLSVADIPLGGFHFTGIIGVVLLGGKEYRLATYTGAKIVKLDRAQIVIRQDRHLLVVQPMGPPGQPLRAPVAGAMERTIHEHLCCQVRFRFWAGKRLILDHTASNAALEYEY